MHELNDVQYAILDALYFTEPLDNILGEVAASQAVVEDEIRTLIDWRYVQAMAFDEASQDYLPSAHYDADHMGDYRYVATKEGLLAHNGRG